MKGRKERRRERRGGEGNRRWRGVGEEGEVKEIEDGEVKGRKGR